MAASESLLNSNFDEKQWIVQIEGMLGRDLEEAVKIPPSIFQLPDSITREKPEHYVPSRVALGPYHHYRPDLYHMEIYKLDKAKTARITFELPDDFSLLVNELKQRELKIRACFNKYIAVEGQTLALMMAVDGLYLLWLLEKARVMKENTDSTPEKKKATELLKTDYATERDALLLENQIPVEVLNGILAGKKSNEEKILPLLFNYCSLISPFDLPAINSTKEILLRSRHLLHFLYNLITSQKTRAAFDDADYCLHVPGLFDFLVKCLGVVAPILNLSFLQQLASLLDLLKTGTKLFSSEEKPDPLVPSVSKLAKAGVKIEPTTFEGMKGTSFSRERVKDPFTLKLPLITVNSFSEVILRNLVAFELTSMAGPPFLTRYIGLMSGLVETGEDVQLLVTKMIIRNDLGSDDEVVKLFRAIWSSTVSHLDSYADELGEEDDELAISQANLWETGLLEVPPKEIKVQSEPLISKPIRGKKIRVIEDINQFYEGLWRVKTKKFLKKYIFSALKILILIVLTAIVALVILRTICSFFSCPKILKSS